MLGRGRAVRAAPACWPLPAATRPLISKGSEEWAAHFPSAPTRKQRRRNCWTGIPAIGLKRDRAGANLLLPLSLRAMWGKSPLLCSTGSRRSSRHWRSSRAEAFPSYQVAATVLIKGGKSLGLWVLWRDWVKPWAIAKEGVLFWGVNQKHLLMLRKAVKQNRGLLQTQPAPRRSWKVRPTAPWIPSPSPNAPLSTRQTNPTKANQAMAYLHLPLLLLLLPSHPLLRPPWPGGRRKSRASTENPRIGKSQGNALHSANK